MNLYHIDLWQSSGEERPCDPKEPEAKQMLSGQSDAAKKYHQVHNSLTNTIDTENEGVVP